MQSTLGWHPKEIKILVVDDEPTARIVVRKLLEKTGYTEVEVVESGRKAIELIENRSFNLVLCDLHMPDIDGIGVVKAVRKKAHMDDSPIVMMSATEDLNIVYKCLSEGADDYLLKPIQANAVKNLWQNVWRKRKEKETANMLSHERNKSKAMDEELVGLRKQVESLKSQFSEAVETPINVITRTIDEITKTEGLTSEVRSALSVIIKSLNSSNLYKPAFTKFLSKGGNQLDSMTQDWLTRELAYESVFDEQVSSAATPTTWPHVREADGTQAQSDRINQLRSWDFDVWQYDEEELLLFLEEMFRDFDLINLFKIEEQKLRAFLIEVRNGYSKKNPYHNFRHAFDVTHCCYLVLTSGGAMELVTHLEIFALLISAICHDFEHPGLNNTFLANTSNSLALRYNDRSILENHHCARAFLLMRKPETEILTGLTDLEYRELRKIVVNCILSTDMLKHVEIVTKFTTMVDQFTRENREHRALLLEIILKCADISNPTRPPRIAAYWSQMVQEEFFAQGDKEKEEGLPVSPFMDRDNSLPGKMVVGFVDFFVAPLYATLVKLLPGMKSCHDRLLDNRARFALLAQEAEDKKKAATTAAAAAAANQGGSGSPATPASSPPNGSAKAE